MTKETKAPERIWAEPGMPGYLDEASPAYTVEYIRADLYDALLKAANVLAEVSHAMADDEGDYWKPYVKAAITAYKRTKEK